MILRNYFQNYCKYQITSNNQICLEVGNNTFGGMMTVRFTHRTLSVYSLLAENKIRQDAKAPMFPRYTQRGPLGSAVRRDTAVV